MAAPMESSLRSGTGQYGAASQQAARPAAQPPAPPPPDERTEVYRPPQQGLIAHNALPPEPPTRNVNAPAAQAPRAAPPVPPPPPPTVAARPAPMPPRPSGSVPALPPAAAPAAHMPPRPSGPVPAVAMPPRPSGPALQPAVPVSNRTMTQTGPVPAPMPAHVHAPVAAPPPAPRAPAPMAQAHMAQAPVAQAAVAQPAAKSSASKWLVIAITALLMVGGAGVVVTKMGSGSDIEVVNLEPGELLYVSGVQTDARNVRMDGSSTYVISTAMNGRLRRFGTTMRKDVIDVRTLPEAMPQPGSSGTVSIGGKTGCYVKVGSDMLSGSTPVKTKVPAGQELEVTVSCPGQPVWMQKVMAVPGQDLELLPTFGQ